MVVVHLARGSEEMRQEQAKGLRLWAADQELPVIGIGDSNLGHGFATVVMLKLNSGSGLMTQLVARFDVIVS